MGPLNDKNKLQVNKKIHEKIKKKRKKWNQEYYKF